MTRKCQVRFCRAAEGVTPSLTLIIRNEGLRILALGTSASALGGSVRPKRFGRKSTTDEATPRELGSGLSSPARGA